MASEIVSCDKSDDFHVVADYDLGLEWKPACQLGAQPGAGDSLTKHERPGCADIDRAEMFQLRGERRRPEPSVTTHVDASQKDDERHDPYRFAAYCSAPRKCSDTYGSSPTTQLSCGTGGM